MESNEPKPNSVLNTPKRVRSSVPESQRSPLGLSETGQLDSATLGRKDPITPGRSSRTLNFRTPSRSEGLAAVQTPRRSCRKSIKPIQEYENIVAQKGLSAKRLITDPTPSNDVEKEASSTTEIRQSKWTPADIGRVSNKRSKKKRNKNKRLERQKNIVVEEEKNVEIEEGAKSDEELDDKNQNDFNVEDVINTDENSVRKEEDNKHVETLLVDMPSSGIQIEQNNSVESDASMEGGDVILNSMPITGDDCMYSPEKPHHEDIKTTLSATPVTESANKSDDSDCIMLSLNDSSQSRQSISQKSSSITLVSKCEANDSSDSMANNMPPLLLCSDDEDEAFVDSLKSPDGENLESPIDNEQFESKDAEHSNGTFNAKENIEEDFIDTEIDGEMGSEQEECIDNVMCVEEIRKIVLGVGEKPEDLISSAAQDAQISPLNETFEADEPLKKTMDTPKNLITQSSITRILTPFKTDKSIVPDIIIEPEEEFEDPAKYVYEITENKLKSSRKRSFSFCVDRPKKNVTFRSPANTMVNAYPGYITKSASKRTPLNITKRRKRSLSVTETERDFSDYIEMKKTTHDSTPKKKVVQQSKIKMPNFSNIHQKHFQRMESITDHIARRAERAKILINSSTKVKPASVQKGLPLKNSVLRDHNKDGNKKQIPKARQRIDMSQPENKINTEVTNSLHIEFKSRSKSKQDLRLLDDLPSVGKTPTKVSANSTSLFKSNNTNKLPKERFNFNFNATIVPTSGNTTVTSVPRRIHLPNPREKFNLSTTITATRQPPKADKLDDRRKRMMEMFKSKSSQRVAENKKEILKGVRTNRRFELQMMCRNRQN